MVAERQGFEPWVDGLPPTHFPGVRLRPLGHLSVRGVIGQAGGGVQVATGIVLSGS